MDFNGRRRSNDRRRLFVHPQNHRRHMRRGLKAVLLLSAAVAACADEPSGPQAIRTDAPAPLYSSASAGIKDSYIIVLKDGAEPTAVAAIAGVRPTHVYTAALNGFSATLNEGQLNALRHNPNVDYVEADQEFTASTTVTASSWGLDRIDQRNLPLSGTFTYTATASAVRAY